MIRAVLDANVFVSAILNPHGSPARIVRAWRGGWFELVVSAPILTEIARVLRYPKIQRRHRWSEQQINTFLEDLSHLAIVAAPEQSLNVVADDPADNRYLECALAAGAEWLVSGDQHLLGLEAYETVSILSPAQFVELLESHPQRN